MVSTKRIHRGLRLWWWSFHFDFEVGDGVVEVNPPMVTSLGGDDVDSVLISGVCKYKEDNGVDVHGDKLVLQRLKEAVEKTRTFWCTQDRVEYSFLYVDPVDPNIRTRVVSSQI